MKKVLLSAFAILTFANVSAQKKPIKAKIKETSSTSSSSEGFGQGDIFITGGLGISTTSQGDATNSNFTFKPQAGYFVTDNIAVGLAIGYSNTKEDNTVTITKTSEFNFGAFGRYYFTPADKFSFFGELALGYLSQNQENIPLIGPSTTNKGSGFQIGVSPGINYFLNSHFAIETSVGLLGYKTVGADDVPNAKPTNTFDFKVDFSDVKFGLLYKF
jgi:opacity protein-like surface antigen